MPLTSAIRTLWTGHRRIRVALMGTKSSGKTVFLTAIANHLCNHSPENFNLGGLRVSFRGPLPDTALDGFPLFDATGAWAAFERGTWPPKTTEPSLLALPLTLTDEARGKREVVLLEVLDIPGERVADFPMMGRSYKEWCVWLQTAWAGSNGTSGAYRGYLARVGAISPADPSARAALFDAYRDFVADGYAHYAPHVTPSVLKLEWNGTAHGGPSAEAFRQAIQNVPLGIAGKSGRLREFAPLPSSAFARRSPWRPLVREFSKAYDLYADKVVRPLEDWLGGATSLVYLVDVLELLRAGSRAWFSEKSYGEAAIRMLCPRREGNLLARVGRGLWGMLVQTDVRRVRVVATKADLVLAEDRDNLKKLAELLLGNVLDTDDAKTLACAAVCSTVQAAADQNGTPAAVLRGRLDGAPGGPAQTWIPSAVPSAPPRSTDLWQSLIDAGQFNYPSTFPAFDPSLGIPPDHLGLNAVVKDMLAK